MVNTAEMGYTQGYREYSIVEKGERVFLVMQQDPEQYNELVALLENL